jgi:hypothetical protein
MCLCALRLLDSVISVIRCFSFLRLFRVWRWLCGV